MDSTPHDDELLDPATSERRYYRERVTLLEREIWRPGDGEGDQGTDYFDRSGPPLPLENRWRLFQSDIGKITAKNQPPRFVILDDRAVYEVLDSDIPRAKLSKNWPHEFGGPGKVRTRRPHRGRPAIQDTSAEGDAKFHSTSTANGKETYFFSGEKDFQPIFYRYEPPQEEPKKPKRKRMPSPTSEEYNPRGHGHNQYTPKDMMVKNGAASFSLKEKRPGLPRPNRTLPTDSISPSRSSRERSSGMTPENGMAIDAALHFDPSEMPPNMGHNERRAFEQQHAARIVASVKNDDDIKMVANELAKANVKAAQQAQEIEHLKQALTSSAHDERTAQAEVKKAKAQVTKHEQKISQQVTEIATLQEEIATAEAKQAEMQGEVEALRQGQWYHP